MIGFRTSNGYGYIHLEPNAAIYVNQIIHKGQALGRLVYGPFAHTDKCSYYADQLGTSYHLHFSFPVSGGQAQFEDWVLNVSSQTFVRGSETVRPSGYMWARWNSEPIAPVPTVTPGGPPTPTPGPGTIVPTLPAGGISGTSGTVGEPTSDGGGGGSFWDPIVAYIWDRAASVAASYPERDDREMVTTTSSAALTMVRVAYIMLKSNFNLVVTALVVGIIFMLEGVRVIVAVYRFIKDMIPVA